MGYCMDRMKKETQEDTMPRSNKELTARERAHPQTMTSASIPMPVVWDDWMARKARETGRSKSALYRIAVSQYIERNGGEA